MRARALPATALALLAALALSASAAASRHPAQRLSWQRHEVATAGPVGDGRTIVAWQVADGTVHTMGAGGGERRLAVPVGVCGLVLFAGTAPGFLGLDEPFTEASPFAWATRALFGAAGWCWVLALLGLLDRPRATRPPSRALVYLGVAALPVYVLHQPVVVAVAYGVVGLPGPIIVKYTLIVAGSLVAVLALYELLVRRTRPTRFLLGMRTVAPRPGSSP